MLPQFAVEHDCVPGTRYEWTIINYNKSIHRERERGAGPDWAFFVRSLFCHPQRAARKKKIIFCSSSRWRSSTPKANEGGKKSMQKRNEFATTKAASQREPTTTMSDESVGQMRVRRRPKKLHKRKQLQTSRVLSSVLVRL
jgi:hypothetical protein